MKNNSKDKQSNLDQAKNVYKRSNFPLSNKGMKSWGQMTLHSQQILEELDLIDIIHKYKLLLLFLLLFYVTHYIELY